MNPLPPLLTIALALLAPSPSQSAPITKPLPIESSAPAPAPTTQPTTPVNPHPKPTPIPYNLDPQPNDPLLPLIAQKRPLSPLEKSSLRTSLDRLDLDAQTQLPTNPDNAFRTWFRSLSLRRYLGPQEETIALGRIGSQAWTNSRAKDVQAITQRLKTVQAEHLIPSKSGDDPQLLSNFGYAYAQVRAIAEGITIRERVLDQARQQRNRPRELSILRLLSQDYLNAFRYPQAAKALTALIAIAPNSPPPAPTRPPTLSKLGSLGPKPTPKPTPNPADPSPRDRFTLREQLVYCYVKQSQWPDAIDAQTQLITTYNSDPIEAPRIPVAQFDLGTYQENAKRWIDATQTYQIAYRSADATQQYAIAKTALQRLAQLYRQRKQPQDALKVYEILLDVEQRTYDTYGLIDTYLTIGDLQAPTDNNQARRAYQSALGLARQLNSRQAEIEAKINSLNP